MDEDNQTRKAYEKKKTELTTKRPWTIPDVPNHFPRLAEAHLYLHEDGKAVLATLSCHTDLEEKAVAVVYSIYIGKRYKPACVKLCKDARVRGGEEDTWRSINGKQISEVRHIFEEVKTRWRRFFKSFDRWEDEDPSDDEIWAGMPDLGVTGEKDNGDMEMTVEREEVPHEEMSSSSLSADEQEPAGFAGSKEAPYEIDDDEPHQPVGVDLHESNSTVYQKSNANQSRQSDIFEQGLPSHDQSGERSLSQGKEENRHLHDQEITVEENLGLSQAEQLLKVFNESALSRFVPGGGI
ncbi:hypothetical protein EJ08DRAFT_693417 [Tothia fuscella]|uniref:Uncharacterized protein n=1 Tax=Tothia fuscella TaxID=1048955 RepID=A0A9P4U2J9_9PEZI|nr:hypothetical protein EJ08DRAFT_693417 [Tothia fuscella]